ncbi:MAG: pyridoxal 5'-phosphate synthase glutaminase subunit PdxT [Thermoplasmataceae archaeon]
MSIKIGIVGFQGDVSEHVIAVRRLSDTDNIVEPVLMKRPQDVDTVNGIIIPGGESTTIYKLINRYGLYDRIVRSAEMGMPVMGTCAGLIIMSKETNDIRVKGMGLLDVKIRRNAYGRQIDSFIEPIDINGIGKFNAVFIRAPIIDDPGRTEVLARRGGEPVMVRQGNRIGLTFHPELTDDLSVHRMFLRLVEGERYISTGGGKIE